MFSDFHSSDMIVASPVRLIGVSIDLFHLFVQIVPIHYPGDWFSFYIDVLFSLYYPEEFIMHSTSGPFLACKAMSLFCLDAQDIVLLLNEENLA